MKEERIGGLPIHFHADREDQSGGDSDIDTTARVDDLGGQSGGMLERVDHREAESCERVPGSTSLERQNLRPPK